MNMRPVSTVDISEPISKAMSEITRNGIDVVVLRNGKYYGLIGDRDLRNSVVDLSREKCERVAVRAPSLTKKSSLLEITTAFFAGRWKALPVLEKDKILGMVSRSDVIEGLLEEKLVRKGPVSELMSHPVVSIGPNATLSQAKELMKKTNVRRLVVTEGDSFRGIISTFDIAEEKIFRGQGKDALIGDKVNLEKTTVSSYMRSEIETISPSAAIADAAQRMVDKDISALVVLDGSRPIGVIAARDIFESAIAVEDEANVYISGLEPDDKELYPEIVAYCKDTLDKLKLTFEVRSLSVHIKRHGEKKYSLRARLQSKELVTVSAQGWSLPEVLKTMRDELKKIMAKKKFSRIHRK